MKNINKNKREEDTLYETCDISIKNEHSDIKPFELSIETTIYQKKLNMS